MFESVNPGYSHVFKPGQLSVGLVLPIEAHPISPVPTMTRHLERVQLAEELGFSAIWLRDVPFNVPSFGDAGQTYDPWVYLGLLAGQTKRITLGAASIILPLRHPAHVAKAAASVDSLSNGRLVLGVASGDRPDEFPAMNVPFDERGQLFRSSFEYVREMSSSLPNLENQFGNPGNGMEMLPRPVGDRLPLLLTGSSQQSPDWIAQNGDGWMTYPRDISVQADVLQQWRERVQKVGRTPKPAMQPLYVDLVDDNGALPVPIHLGFRLGVDALRDHLKELEEIGINHVALNLRFNQAPIEATLKRLADEVLPDVQTSGETP